MVKKSILICSILFYITNLFSQKYTDAKIKTAYLYKFAQNLNWSNENQLSTFDIVVYGEDTSMMPEIRMLAKTKTLKNKPITLKWLNNINQLSAPFPQLMYVSNEQNYEIEKIFDKVVGNHTLLVTDENEQRRFVMINFIYGDLEKKKISFEINTKTIADQKIEVTPKLITLGGTEINVRELYKKTEAELQDEKLKVEKQLEELRKQNEVIRLQNEEIESKKSEIEKQRKEISTQAFRIEEQKINLQKVLGEVRKQNIILQDKLTILEKQKLKIHDQEEKIEKQAQEELNRNKRLDTLNSQIAKKEAQIKNQDSILNKQETKIQTQKGWLILAVITIGLFVVMVIIIYRNFKIKQNINKKLEEKNTEIQQQKEEIQSQAELLSTTNKELEKLSIVASETDSAVMIMDAEGNFQWVNAGFVRLTGYTFAEFTQIIGSNIRVSSMNNDIASLIEKCLTDKETVIYESSFITKNGLVIWTQTTLTPIIDNRGNITKLVAIDSDISKLKTIEMEIQQKNEELISQKDELSIQKERIVLQNQHIRSSIIYAKTIQNAILPPKEDIDKYFDNFILYRPKDIVSGDFYWFAYLPAKHIYTEKIYLAAVDCTGHGVPGAFMSMIGNRLLNEIVFEKEITSPKHILITLNALIRKALRQDKTDNTDGVDICLCRFEKDNEKHIVTFSGARRPLYYYQADNNGIKMIKGDRKTIGGYVIKKNLISFINHEIILKKDDIIYLTTDGYIDQNAPDRKRFGTIRFLDILAKICKEPMPKQKSLLDEFLVNYMDNQEQRDDITILGIKMI